MKHDSKPSVPLSERVIFPLSPSEKNGIEDARFVLFTDDDGSKRYYATYTAYDGKVILPQLMETDDFVNFKMSTWTGAPLSIKNGHVPAKDKRPLCDDITPGRWESLFNVLW